MREFKKLFEVFQKYGFDYLIVHWEQDGINYVIPSSVALSLLPNVEVNRIQKKGEYRHVYLRKED